MTKSAYIDSRALLRINGSEAIGFLQNLITCDVEDLSPGAATFGALLTPQGKILFDFFVLRETDGVVIDVSTNQRDALLKRLTFYKLRADVTITPVDDLKVFVFWDGSSETGFPDPRLPKLGDRLFASDLQTSFSALEWEEHRITLGVPESGADFDLNDAFPHEVLMDQFTDSGVDFSKGCYVGQEVVSRMQHRGTARNRWIKVKSDTQLPIKGTPIEVEGRAVGKMGSSAGDTGLAVIRLDKAKAALDSKKPVVGGEAMLELEIPSFASFGWPK